MASKKRKRKRVGNLRQLTGTRRKKSRARKTGTRARARSSALPALSTLIKQPKARLKAGVNRYSTALEMKEMPGLFSPSGGRLRSGPKRRRKTDI
jgi:hypothetical protein